VDFDELYNAYADDVYRYAFSLCGNRHTAEDITSETFLKAIKASDRFKGDCNVRVLRRDGTLIWSGVLD